MNGPLLLFNSIEPSDEFNKIRLSASVKARIPPLTSKLCVGFIIPIPILPVSPLIVNRVFRVPLFVCLKLKSAVSSRAASPPL